PGEAPQRALRADHRQHAAVRPAGRAALLPCQVPDQGARPGALRRASRPGALLAQPGDGRGRVDQGAHARNALRHAPLAKKHLVRLMGRRVLITGLGTFWGGRVAKALEADPDVDVIVGVDTQAPKLALERTEFVRADQSYSILARIVKATEVDTILHTFLVVDSTRMSGRSLHEINVIGTMNLLAAAGGAGSTVRQVVVKSSTLVYGSNYQDPVWFGEETPRTRAPRTRVERSLLEVEDYLRDFAEDNPHVTVTLLRFSNVLGTDIVTPISKALQLP